jgi:hypothetical protein
VIVYRLRRGYETILAVPRSWLVDAGRPVLQHLADLGLLHEHNGRWRRTTTRRNR